MPDADNIAFELFWAERVELFRGGIQDTLLAGQVSIETLKSILEIAWLGGFDEALRGANLNMDRQLRDRKGGN